VTERAHVFPLKKGVDPTLPCSAWWALLCVLLTGGALRGESSVPLTVGGKPVAAIVIARDAAGCVPFAAQELQTHVEKMSGAKLPLLRVDSDTRLPLPEVTSGKTAVLLGENAWTRHLGVSAAGLPSDSFRIRTGEGWVAIVGRDGPEYHWNFRWVPAAAGTLYGVYHLLEDLGIRWFYPTDLGTVIPHRRDIAVGPYSFQDAPYFAYRHTGYGDRSQFVWLRRNGAGGDRDVWSTMHTYESLGFYKKYGKTHPEYFGLTRDGRRTNAVALAHPGVVEATIQLARERFRTQKLPGRKYFLVIPQDGRGCCACKLCQSKLDPSRGPDGDMSDYVAEAAVKVAKGIGPGFDDCFIVYCAYSRYQLPPRKLTKLPPNMVVLIAQPRGRFYDERTRRRAYELIAGWQKLRPQALYFCRYYNSMIKMTPSLAPHLIARDLRHMKQVSEQSEVKLKGEMNFCGIAADSPHAWWFQLNQYVTTKLLWNPGLDVEALLADYCMKCYGPAAPEMQRILTRCENLYEHSVQRDVYHVDTIDELEATLTAAKQKTAGTIYERRLALVDRGFELLRQMRRKLRSAEQQAPPVNPDQGLVVYLPFDEGKGALTRETASGRMCKVVNAHWTEGRVGQALEFSGRQSAVHLEPVSLADTDYTIMAWIRPAKTRFDGDEYIVGPSMWYRLCLKIVSGRLTLLHRSPEYHRLSAPVQEFTDHVWWHVAGTFSRRDGMALYINGRLVALDTTAVQPTRFCAAFIGASGDGGTTDPNDVTGCFAGAIDEVRIYNRELSPREILAHARSDRTPPRSAGAE